MDSEGEKRKSQAKSLKIITKNNILWLVFACCLFLALMIYYFFGTTEDVIRKNGYLSSNKSIREIHQPYNGILVEYPIKIGDYVKKGDVIAKVYTGDMSELLKFRNTDITELREDAIEVTSPYNGYLAAYGSKLWDKVTISSPIVTIGEDSEQGMQHAISVVTADELSKFAIGMKARVYIDGISYDEYGYVNGEVESIKELTQFEFVSKYFDLKSDESIGYHVILIKLECNNGKPVFSLDKIPELELTFGNPCKIDFIVKERKVGYWYK